MSSLMSYKPVKEDSLTLKVSFFILGFSVAVMVWLLYKDDPNVKWHSDPTDSYGLTSIHLFNTINLPRKLVDCAMLKHEMDYANQYKGEKDLTLLKNSYAMRFHRKCYFTGNLDKVPLPQSYKDQARASFENKLAITYTE